MLPSQLISPANLFNSSKGTIGDRLHLLVLLLVVSLQLGCSTYNLYAARSSQLWIIDKTTGSGTLIGTSNHENRALACSETIGKLYGVTGEIVGGFLTNRQLIAIDAQTGQSAVIGPIGYNVRGLAYDSGNGILYGMSDLNQLVTIDRGSGAGTPIGPPGLNLAQFSQSLAFYPFTGWVYSFDENDILYHFHPQTQDAGTHGTHGLLAVTIHGLTYDAKTKTMYASTGSRLIKINLNSGQGTEIGNFSTSGFYSGLAACRG